MALTEKQERFVRAWVETGNKTEAYRRAYSASGMKEATINSRACELSVDGKVAGRYAELTAEAQKRSNVTVDTVKEMLSEAFRVAGETGTPSAMVSAAMGLIKLYGLDVETQHRVKSDGSGTTVADALKEVAERLPD